MNDGFGITKICYHFDAVNQMPDELKPQNSQ
jgi:hypothetical protein